MLFSARRRAIWLFGWMAALAAGGASSALLTQQKDAASQSPAWMSITTASLTAEAEQCYRREARWQGSAYCASPVADILEVVWASCFGEERNLLLAAIEDSDSDETGMNFLADLEARSRPDIVSIIKDSRSISPRCGDSD